MDEKELLKERFKLAVSSAAKAISENLELEVKFVEREKLSQEISSFDLLGFYLKENFSINASMPTKIAETLACGIPIVCNGFNEDIKNILEKNDIGLIYNFSDRLTEQQLDGIVYLIRDPDTAPRCLRIAEEYFSLEKGTSVYVNLYSKLLY